MYGWIPSILSTAGAWGGSIKAGIDAIFGNGDEEEQKRYQAALDLQKETAEKNIALQKEFAKSGLQWRVEDAKKAGIHPVAALGASGTSFSPISISEPSPPRLRDSPDIGDVLGSMGQNISRAIQATASLGDRLDLQMKEEQLKGMKLDNALRSQRLAPPAPSQVGPAMPTEPVIQPDVSFTKTTRGGLAPVPSEAFADRAEDQWLPQIAWGFRNLIAPVFPENRGLADGEVWMWNPLKFEFERGTPDSFGAAQRYYNQFLRWSSEGKTYDERRVNAKNKTWHPPLANPPRQTRSYPSTSQRWSGSSRW